MATRSQVREVVVQLLYAYGSGNEGISKFVEEILEEHKIKNAQKDFALSLFSGVIENYEALDLRITHQLKSWDFARVGNVERAILRLGTYEIVFSKIDKAVVINEALEIAKNFGYEPSVKFINGVLDGIAKNLEMSLEQIQELLNQQNISVEQVESQNEKEISKDLKPKIHKNESKTLNKTSKKPQSLSTKSYKSKDSFKSEKSRKDCKVRRVSQKNKKGS